MNKLRHLNEGLYGWYVEFTACKSMHEIQEWRNWLRENTNGIWETTHNRDVLIGAWIKDEEAAAFKLKFGL